MDCRAVEQLDPVYLSRDSEEGAAWSADDLRKLERDKAECRRLGADARARLQTEFSVTSRGMSDGEAINRLALEQDKREQARQAAERDRINAVARSLEQNALEMRNQSESAMQRQNELLKQLGTSPEALNIPDEDASDEELDAAELSMYQQMINNGIAPGCRGKQGQDLISCVDAALDAEP